MFRGSRSVVGSEDPLHFAKCDLGSRGTAFDHDRFERKKYLLAYASVEIKKFYLTFVKV